MNPGFQGTVVQQDKIPTLICKAKSVAVSVEKSLRSWSPTKYKEKEPRYTRVDKIKLGKGCG